MNKKLTENPVKKFARRMLREGEIENAEAALAAKDQVDRLQDMVEELGKMNNEELPKLVDKIRASFGSEQATAYQQAASGVLSELLTTVAEKKGALEQAVLVLTGDAQAEQGPKTDMELPDEISPEGEDVDGNELEDFAPEAEEAGKKAPSPLGREPRLPASESRKFNKKLAEAKIVALKKALDETDTKKFPVKAKRLAEELRRVAIQAIKEEAKSKKADNVKKNSKEMMKPVKEAKSPFKKGDPAKPKSGMVKKAAEKAGVETKTVRMKKSKPEDLKGMPKLKEGKSTECKKCGDSLVSHMSKNIGYCTKCAKKEGKMSVPAKKIKESSDVTDPKFQCKACSNYCENDIECTNCGNDVKSKFSPLSKIKN